MIEKILNIADNLGKKLATKHLFGGRISGMIEKFPSTFSSKEKYIIYQIKPFVENEHGIAQWNGFLSNFSNLKEKITFFIKGNKSKIKFFAKIPEGMKDYFENVFYASFPTSDLEQVDMEANEKGTYLKFENAEFLTDEDFTKNGTFLEPTKDILSIYNGISEKNGQLYIFYNYIFSVDETKFEKLLNFLKNIFVKLIFAGEEKSETDTTEEEKDLKFSVSYYVDTSDSKLKSNIEKNIKSNYDKFLSSGKVATSKKPAFHKVNFNQVVNFFHLPTKENFIKNLEYIHHRKLPYPGNIPTIENSEQNDITLLGNTDYKSDNFKFGIRNEDKFKHMYIIGKTGMGKSTMISNMARSDTITNKGLAIIDPHGDLVDTVLEHMPNRRINDVVLFDVGDTDYPIGFNVFQYQTEEEKQLVVSGILGTFKKLYGHSWGPRLEYILRNVLLSIIEYPNATIMHMLRMLTDKNFKEEVLQYVTDSTVLKFWRNEFDKWQDNFKNEAISPIINKVGQFISSPLIRNIFGQPKTKLNFRKIMDEGKILLVNLSKGKIGEDNASMIGSFIVTKLQIDAMSRANIPFEERKDFYLYIDEFQNFATESFENILSEARKYKLSLIMANQYISQIDENIRHAIFGNVGSIISFGLGYDDATIMSNQFKEMISVNDILSLPKFKAYTKLMIDGIVSDPFSMSTFPLPKATQGEDTKQKIRNQSRQRYAMEKSKLEKLLQEWNKKTFSQTEKVMEKAKQEGKQEVKKGNKQTENKANTDQNQKQQTTEVKQDQKQKETVQSPGDSQEFNINHIQLGEWYQGYVKLKYNFGVFVTVKGVEGLLHKKAMDVSEGVRWKDLYEIGDTIQVKAEDFKDVDGEKRVVWTQL